MIWREKSLLLAVVGVLLAANTLFFFTYRVQYESRLQELDQRLADSKARLDQARAARVAAERRYQTYRKIQGDVQEVFNERWATQAERLAPLITEIQRLAVASQLVPQSYGFAKTDAAPVDADRSISSKGMGATVVGINYSVSGTYEQVRRLINLLELSQQFVIIDQIALSSQEDKTLVLNLRLKTLFRNEGQPQQAAPRAGQSL